MCKYQYHIALSLRCVLSNICFCVSFCVSASVTWCTAQRDGCQLPRFPPAVGPLTKKPSSEIEGKGLEKDWNRIRDKDRQSTRTESETRIDKGGQRRTKEDNTAKQKQYAPKTLEKNEVFPVKEHTNQVIKSKQHYIHIISVPQRNCEAAQSTLCYRNCEAQMPRATLQGVLIY